MMRKAMLAVAVLVMVGICGKGICAELPEVKPPATLEIKVIWDGDSVIKRDPLLLTNAVQTHLEIFDAELLGSMPLAVGDTGKSGLVTLKFKAVNKLDIAVDVPGTKRRVHHKHMTCPTPGSTANVVITLPRPDEGPIKLITR